MQNIKHRTFTREKRLMLITRESNVIRIRPAEGEKGTDGAASRVFQFETVRAAKEFMNYPRW